MKQRKTTTALLVIALCLLAGTAHHLNAKDTGPTASYPDTPALRELQASEANTLRREAAGQALCREARGKNAIAGWTEEGHLICRLKTVPATEQGQVLASKTSEGK